MSHTESTQAIVVIKGAGTQKPGQTRDKFISGFWPAVLEDYPDAQIRFSAAVQHPDSTKETSDHVEIQVGKNRVWVSEANWDEQLNPPGPVTSLIAEWRMASYAFSTAASEAWWDTLDSFSPSLRRSLAGLRGRPAFDTVGVLLLLGMPALVLNAPVRILASRSASVSRFVDQPTAESAQILWTWFALVALASLPVLIERIRFGFQRRLMLPGQPAPDDLLLVLIFAALIANPLAYLGALAILTIAQLSALVSRHLVWKWRPADDSDTRAVTRSAEAGLDRSGEQARDRKGRVSQILGRASALIQGLIWYIFHFVFVATGTLYRSNLVYRYLVAMALPVAGVLVGVAAVLRWTRVLRGLGDALDGVVRSTLSGTLGDITSYALDPAHASRVRAAVDSRLEWYGEHEDVNAVHIVAHSQGTPIAYEAVFRFSSPKGLKKVRTLFTLGSVLGYYRLADRMLTSRQEPRFPLQSQTAPRPDFQWVNFWSLLDPITEFRALDDFTAVNGLPISVRVATGWLPWKAHSGYWIERSKIQRPLAARVFGPEPMPPEWIEPCEHSGRRKAHAVRMFAVALFMLFALASIVGRTFRRLGEGWLADLEDRAAASPVAEFILRSLESVDSYRSLSKIASEAPVTMIASLQGGLVQILLATAVLMWLGRMLRAINPWRA